MLSSLTAAETICEIFASVTRSEKCNVYKCLQLTSKNAETQCWIAKTVWQRIPGRRACNSKTPTTKTVQTIARNDQRQLYPELGVQLGFVSFSELALICYASSLGATFVRSAHTDQHCIIMPWRGMRCRTALMACRIFNRGRRVGITRGGGKIRIQCRVSSRPNAPNHIFASLVWLHA